MINGGHFKRLYCPKICCYAWAFLLCGPYLVCQIDLVHLMSYIVYWYEPSDLAYEISHLIWHMRFTAIWGNRSTVDPIVLPIICLALTAHLYTMHFLGQQIS